jgi:hypothetical protein
VAGRGRRGLGTDADRMDFLSVRGASTRYGQGDTARETLDSWGEILQE